MRHFRKTAAVLLLALVLAFAMTACGESKDSYSGPTYVDYEIGDPIYDDGTVSFAITSMTENEDNGYNMSILATNNGEKNNMIITFEPYDTEKYNEYIDKVEDGKNASISPTASGVTFYLEMEDESENFTGEFEWDAKYIYYGVKIYGTTEEVTEENVQELLDSEDTETLLDTRLKIDISGVTSESAENTATTESTETETTETEEEG
ncbi:MAG: hypothetical protein LUC17_04265 [Oscillospiraceae bacterium]|nr:hypothetical protein [Oscillospiraceae bacterium]